MIRKLVIAMLGIAVSSGFANAQVGPIAGLVAIPLAGREIKSIIGDLQNAAQHLLLDGQATGNALEVGLGDQIRVATENGRLALQDQQDRLFEQTDKGIQGFFTQLNDTITTANVSVDRALSVLEAANLNLIDLTNRLPLTSKVYTFINKVSGLAQLPSASPYRVELQGLGLGQDTNVASYKIDVSVNGTAVPLTSITRTPPYTTVVSIPNQILDPLFDDKAIKFQKMDVTVTATVAETCMLFFNCHKTVVGNWSLQLTLLPRYAGTLEVTEIVNGQALDPTILVDHISWGVPNSSTKNPANHCEVKNFAADEHVIGVTYSCGGSGCAFCYNLRGGGYAPDYSILQGGHAVQACRHCDGPASQIDYSVQYQKTDKTSVSRPLDPPVNMQFSVPFQIKLSPDNTACAYKLTTTLATRQSIYLDNSMTKSADGLLVRTGTGEAGPGAPCTPSFVLNIP